MNMPQHISIKMFVIAVIGIALVSIGITYLAIDTSPKEEKKRDVSAEEVAPSETEEIIDTAAESAVTAPPPKKSSPAPARARVIPDIPLPTAELVVDGQVQKGFYGSFCWTPLEYCLDSMFTNLSDAETVRAKTYHPLMVRLESHRTPLELSAEVRTPVASHADIPGNSKELVVENISLRGKDDASFFINVDPGTYIVVVTATWPEGTVEFGFKVEIEA